MVSVWGDRNAVVKQCGAWTKCPWMVHFKNGKKKKKKKMVHSGPSLVAQWLRIHLPVQKTWVQSLVREDPTCQGATKPPHHNYWTSHATARESCTTVKRSCMTHLHTATETQDGQINTYLLEKGSFYTMRISSQVEKKMISQEKVNPSRILLINPYSTLYDCS